MSDNNEYIMKDYIGKKQPSYIYDQVNRLMIDNEMSTRSFERKCGLSNGVISQWRQGKQKPSTEAVTKMATAFNVSTDYFLRPSMVVETEKARADLSQEEITLLNLYRNAKGLDKFKIISAAMQAAGKGDQIV